MIPPNKLDYNNMHLKLNQITILISYYIISITIFFQPPIELTRSVFLWSCE